MDKNQAMRNFLVQLHKTPYYTLPQFPLLHLNSATIISSINQMRKWHGLESMVIENSDIRLIDIGDWKSSDMDVSPYTGFCDTISRVTFVRFNPEIQKNLNKLDTKEMVLTTYYIAHELGHKSMNGNGIINYSWHLNEGFADEIAKYAMNSLRKPEEGVILLENGILDKADAVWHDIFTTTIYCRLLQMYLLRAIKFNNSEAYDRLKYCAFHNKPDIARNVMEKTYGQDLADELAKEELDLVGVMHEIKDFGKPTLY